MLPDSDFRVPTLWSSWAPCRGMCPWGTPNASATRSLAISQSAGMTLVTFSVNTNGTVRVGGRYWSTEVPMPSDLVFNISR